MDRVKRYLIVKTSSLGDIIQTFPTVRYLKEKYPEALIDWIIEEPFADMVRAHPDIHQVLTIDTKQWRHSLLSKETRQEIASLRKRLKETSYDAVFDLQSNLKSSLLTWISQSPYKVGFGKESVHEWPNLFFTNFKIDPPKAVNIREDYLYVVQGFFGEQKQLEHSGVRLKISLEHQQGIDSILSNPALTSRPRILVCPGANWKNKQLPTDTLMEFLLRIHHAIDCSFALAWGTESEKEVASQIHRKLPGCSLVIPRLPLAALQNLMSRLDLIIAMDSLPLHLAATTSTPTYSVFGPSLAAKFKPMGEQHHAYQGSCPYGKTFEKRCSILRTCTTGACMRQLRACPLVEDFLSWWQTKRK